MTLTKCMSRLLLCCTILMSVFACQKQKIPAAHNKSLSIDKVKVQLYDPFPPKRGVKSEHSFWLNATELKTLRTIVPDLKKHNKRPCKCGVDSFYVVFHFSDKSSSGAHFFHGKNSLRLFPSKGTGGSIKVDDKLYNFFYELILKKGFKMKRKTS